MLKILLPTLAFLAVAVTLLAVKLLVKGDASGPMQHIGASEAMRRKGIHCVESMDAIERAQLRRRPHASESASPRANSQNKSIVNT